MGEHVHHDLAVEEVFGAPHADKADLRSGRRQRGREDVFLFWHWRTVNRKGRRNDFIICKPRKRGELALLTLPSPKALSLSLKGSARATLRKTNYIPQYSGGEMSLKRVAALIVCVAGLAAAAGAQRNEISGEP